MFSISLYPNEKLITHIRQSESMLFLPAAIVIALIYLPMAVLVKYELLAKFGWYMFAWTLVVAGYGLRTYVLWLVNSYLITNQRVIVAEHRSLVKKNVRDLEINHISAATYETTGIFSSLFGFGTLTLESGKTGKSLALRNVRKPEEVKHIIVRVQKQQRALRHERPVVI